MFEPFYFVNRKTKYFTPADNLTVYVDKNGAIGKHYETVNNTIDQALDCYSEGKDATCCVGKYTETFSSYDTTTSSWTKPERSVVTRSLSSCLGGPASISEDRDTLGFIVPKFQAVEATGTTADYKIPGTWKQQTGIAWSANYFEAADHAGGIPSVFNYSAGNGVTLGNAYYTLSCFDRAWDLNSQIRIQLRDWNTKTDYEARRTAPTIHDRVGNEPSPYGSKPINDLLDWKDLEGAGILIPNFITK
jgi:hypothetical protein